MNILKNVSNKLLLWLNIVLKLLDVGTTTYVISQWGPALEGNPIVRWAINAMGLIPTMILITVLFALAVWGLYKMNKKGLLAVVAFVMTAVVINNIMVIITS